MPNMAEITGVIPNGWKIQQNTVMLMVITTANSSCDNGPSFFNFSFAIAGASGVSWISGGKSLYTNSGVKIKPRMPGTQAALNHVIHGFAMTIPNPAANFKDSKFCAAAVMHKADE